MSILCLAVPYNTKGWNFLIMIVPVCTLLMSSLYADCLSCTKWIPKKKKKSPKPHISKLNLMLSYNSFEISTCHNLWLILQINFLELHEEGRCLVCLFHSFTPRSWHCVWHMVGSQSTCSVKEWHEGLTWAQHGVNRFISFLCFAGVTFWDMSIADDSGRHLPRDLASLLLEKVG